MRMWIGVGIAIAVACGACSSREAAPSTPAAGTASASASAASGSAAPAPPGACDRDDDCEIHCPRTEGCCPAAPCGCTTAIAKRDEAADADDALPERCNHVDCVKVDCGPPPAVHAACVAHQCEAVADAPPDAAPAPPPDAAPAKPPAHAASADPAACTSASDCEIHCAAAKGCCDSAPCGCRGAINRASEAAVDRDYARTCERTRCPIVDCKYDEPMGADCVNGRCVPLNGPPSGPPGPPVRPPARP